MTENKKKVKNLKSPLSVEKAKLIAEAQGKMRKLRRLNNNQTMPNIAV